VVAITKTETTHPIRDGKPKGSIHSSDQSLTLCRVSKMSCDSLNFGKPLSVNSDPIDPAVWMNAKPKLQFF
jgi:hypothetical protein